MKNKNITMICLIFVMCLCFKIGYSQENVAKNKSNSFASKEFELKIQNGNIKTNLGNTIELKILLKNKSSDLIGLPYERTDFYGGFEVEILNTKGEIVKPLEITMKAEVLLATLL